MNRESSFFSRSNPIPHKTHIVSRPSWSCTECSRRKIRCDKQIPCQPCKKRGKEEGCKRGDDVGLQFEKEGEEDQTMRNGDSLNRISNNSNLGLMEMMSNVLERMKRIEERLDEDVPHNKRARREESPKSPILENLHQQIESNSPPNSTMIDRERENQETSITIEYLALGKNRKLGILSGTKDRHTLTAPTTNILQFKQTQKCPSIVRSMIIGKRVLLEEVLNFHRDNVQWQHACIHSQTFDRQKKVFMDFLLENENDDDDNVESNLRFWSFIDPLWLALFFSIQTVTLHQMPLIDHQKRQSLVDGMLMASLKCLEIGDYMSKPNFFTCQTIAIFSVCGHNVVDSNHLASLLAVGIKLAQMLNLHVLGAESKLIKYQNGKDDEMKSKLISLEMGKRVWWSLVQQDYFAIPFRGVSLVHPNQHDTPFPNNFMDEEIDRGQNKIYNDGTLTLILKQRITSMTSDILCRFFLNLALEGVKMEEHVQPFEDALRKLLPDRWNFAPSSSSSSNRQAYGNSLINYLNISVRHKILVIHRAFCGRKPKRQSELRSSQERCVHLARSILTFCVPSSDFDTTSKSLPGQLEVMWTTAYHAVAAATVLALDMFGQTNINNSNERREEVQEAYKILNRLSDRSPIAQRGVTLLSSLLQQYDSIRGGVNNISDARPSNNIPSNNLSTSRLSSSITPSQNVTTTPSSNYTWEMNDWEQYQEIVSMLENNPDVGRLFDGTLGDPFA